MVNTVLKIATGIGILSFLLKKAKPAPADSQVSEKKKYDDENPHGRHPFDPLPGRAQPPKPVPVNTVRVPAGPVHYDFPGKNGWLPLKQTVSPPEKLVRPFDPIPERFFKRRKQHSFFLR